MRPASPWGGVFAATALLFGCAATPAGAQVVGEPVLPIPDPLTTAPEFEGEVAVPRPVSAPRVPRHPFMAPNGRSNLHNDAFQTDTYRWRGPLGDETTSSSALFFRECASITVDSQGRLVAICVGLDRPVLAMLDPETLAPLATYELPPRMPGGGGNPFTDFSGGGYFYLDHRDRVVVPTTTRHIFVIRQTAGPGFELQRDIDLSGVLASGDKIISALPDWKGRLWFASTQGVMGFVSRRSGAIHTRDLGEPNGNSFMVDERGSVYPVTDGALYRLRARRGKVRILWRRPYKNTGVVKPGQTQAGSGTTPTLIGGGRWVAITDNADPMKVMVVRRARHARGRRLVCREPVFEQGASATDQSLIGAGRSIVVENNYGYTIAAVEGGGDAIQPGLSRVDVRRGGRGCRTVWESDERAPSVVPKLSLGAGLVYTYTLPVEHDGAWYLTAIDFRSGDTVFRRLSGGALGHNNNYAPVTLTPGGTGYVGVLGGVARFRDGG
ncbi:MAG: hypothetical protein ACR2G3_04350 [Solirubrobacterales bacterium]